MTTVARTIVMDEDVPVYATVAGGWCFARPLYPTTSCRFHSGCLLEARTVKADGRGTSRRAPSRRSIRKEAQEEFSEKRDPCITLRL
ncbi:hypothetical protein CRG98_009346 [Punica granatum]|uniref:Uncharacterized protein n=1 Tax=Punica granatum TaxID=22663 RepID=A0A2I0KPA8_PUNGR|nr:hypothetical protein CRG98_009346 [Punica granatum]